MNIPTSMSLLVRLKDPDDEAAWERFYDMYAPLIRVFCRARRCNPSMEEDILQQTMVMLLQQMPRFEYDPNRGRFRYYLKSIVEGRIKDAYKREVRYQQMGSESQIDWLAEQEGKADALSKGEWDQLWEQNLLMQAMKTVRDRVEPLSYRIFQSYMLKEVPAPDVASQFGVPANRVYQIQHRLKRMIIDEAKRLRFELGEAE